MTRYSVEHRESGQIKKEDDEGAIRDDGNGESDDLSWKGGSKRHSRRNQRDDAVAAFLEESEVVQTCRWNIQAGIQRTAHKTNIILD